MMRSDRQLRNQDNPVKSGKGDPQSYDVQFSLLGIGMKYRCVYNYRTITYIARMKLIGKRLTQ